MAKIKHFPQHGVFNADDVHIQGSIKVLTKVNGILCN